MHTTKRSPAWPNAFTALVVGIAAVNYFAVFGDLDWTWQVRTGENIVRERSLKTADQFSYTIHGKELHDYEWLYEVVLYFAWDNFGIGGLKFLRVALVMTPLFIVLRRLSREGVPWHGVLLALFACLFALSPVWNLRPLYCTTIGLVLVSGWLHEHCTGCRPLPWYLPVAMLVWANSHPGVIAGQGLLFGAVVWEWINRFVKWNQPLDGPALKRLTILGVLGLAATFLCPDPIGRVHYAFAPELKHPIHRTFVEMQPSWTTLSQPPFNFAPIYLFAGLMLLTVILRFRQYRLWELAYLGVLTLLGNFATRGAMDWYLNMLALGTPHLCVLWRQALENPHRVRRGLMLDNRIKRMFQTPLFQPQTAWPAAGLAALFVVSVIPPLSRSMPRQDSDEWPVAALDYLEATGQGGNFFGPPDYSTYVNWRLKDKARSYTDTRGFFFPPELLEDSQYLPQMTDGWEARMDRVLNQYKTEYFLLETFGARGQLWRALKQHIASPLFIDDQSVLLSATQVREALPSLQKGKTKANSY
jgi:hypothetical protein